MMRHMKATEHAVHYIEIVTNDVAGTRASYEKVLGLRFDPPRPELGNACVVQLPDGARLGIRAPMHGQEKSTVRTYLRVNDIERAAKLAEEAGAVVAVPPLEIPGEGKIAIYILGAIEQGLWQVP